MKILLVINKTYRGVLDGTHWYLHQPLIELGHNVHLYDTVEGDPDERDFNTVVEHFKPDLVFCMLTGNPKLAPYEPWEALHKETVSGRTKTFKWFCDDTWRFNTFSKVACNNFAVCSTPERGHVEKYHQIGYKNIIVANWHANSKFFTPKTFEKRPTDLSFVGALTSARKNFFVNSNHKMTFYFKLSQEQLFDAFCSSKIGVNLSFNENDPLMATQMKQRMFEIPAGAGLMITQYHEGIEEYYKIDKEIITFNSPIEYNEKLNFLLQNQHVAKSIAHRGHQRYLKEHDSKIRLTNVLEQIMKI